MIDDAVAVAHRYREHVPVRDVDAAREAPGAPDDETSVHFAPAALRKSDPGGDQRVGIGSPHFVLGALVVVGEHPVVDGEIAEVPGGRGAAAADLCRDLEQRDEVELHPAMALRLRDADEPGGVEIGERLGRHPAQGLAACGALAQRGDERAGPGERLAVADTGGIVGPPAHRPGTRGIVA